MPSSWLYFGDREIAKNILKTFAILIAIGISVGLIVDSNNYNKIVEKKELVQITGILTNKPVIETAAEGGPWVPIHLREFPNFKFNIDGVKYSALKAKKFVSDAHIGDTITLEILRHDLNTKILKTQKLRFSERLINYKFIEPYSVNVHGENYMSLKDVNDVWSDNNSLGRFLLIWFLGLSSLVGIIYLVLHLTGVTKKLKQWFPDS